MTVKTVKFTLDPERPPVLTESMKKKLENLRDEDLDYSDIPESSDEALKNASAWNKEAFEREWSFPNHPSNADLRESYSLWSKEIAGISGRFENFWNHKAFAFLNRYHPDVFDRYSTFNQMDAGSLLPERTEAAKELVRGLSRTNWPWTMHASDTMGAVGMEGDPKTGSSDVRRSVIVFGLVQPMEHLALLKYIEKKEVTLKIDLEKRNVLLVPLPSGGREREGDASFYFFYPDEPVSNMQAEALSRNLRDPEHSSIQVMIPVLYDSWLDMRHAYDQSRPWKSFVRFDEVLRIGEKVWAPRMFRLNSGEKVRLDPGFAFSKSGQGKASQKTGEEGIRIETAALHVA